MTRRDLGRRSLHTANGAIVRTAILYRGAVMLEIEQVFV